ncbi:MAG: zinc ribbon domain-containing protein [Desulfobacterales bacterium]|jgi:putative FmdB family regulatory protein
MPIYEYECTKCAKIEEAIQSFSDKPLVKCKHCGGKLHKLISHSSFHLKGTGWYVTDYANKSKTNSAVAHKSPKAKTSQSSDASASSKDSKSSSEGSAD